MFERSNTRNILTLPDRPMKKRPLTPWQLEPRVTASRHDIVQSILGSQVNSSSHQSRRNDNNGQVIKIGTTDL